MINLIDSPHRSTATRWKLRYHLTMWATAGLPQTATQITRLHFEAWRESASARGLKDASIEAVVSSIRALCRQAGQNPHVGVRRRCAVRCKPVPDHDLIASAYQQADRGQWPDPRLCRTPALMRVKTSDWLRAFIVFSFFTGLRIRDLRSATWGSITEDRIEWAANKTRKAHRYPLPEIVRRHLQPLRCSGSERIFPWSKSQESLLRRELHRIGGPTLGPQAIRRASVTTWSCASPEAGRVIHGCGLGVMAHYLDQLRILESALPRLQWPDAFLLPAERDARQRAQTDVMELMDRLPVDRLQDLARIAGAFAG